MRSKRARCTPSFFRFSTLNWDFNPTFRGVALSLVFMFLVAAQCCTVAPAPVVTDPTTWSRRLRSTDAALVGDNTTVLNLKVDGQYNFDEYRFKVGAESTINCGSDSGYTPWTAKATRLQADISSVADGRVRLCIVGRGRNNCNNLITQTPATATFYRWIKDTTGPGSFSITGPSAPQTALTFPVTWGAASGAANYSASVHSAAGCAAATRLSQYSASSNSTNVTVSAAGEYFVCVRALDALGNGTNASNNGYRVTVQTAPQEVIIEDRITNQACWATGAEDPVFFSFGQDGSGIPRMAATFTGNGRPLGKVSTLMAFVDETNTDRCDVTEWDRLKLSLVHFQKLSDYMADPWVTIGREGVAGYNSLLPTNNNPQASNYYRTPVGFDGLGCPIYRIELDLGVLQINAPTVANQASVLVLLRAYGDNHSVIPIAYSGKNNCAGAVGTGIDLYNGASVQIPKTLQEMGFPHWHGLFQITTR